MAVKKWGRWFVIVGFGLLVVFGYFLYTRLNTPVLSDHSAVSVQPEPIVLTLTRQTIEPAELEQLFKQLKKDQFAITERPLERTGFVACSQNESRTYTGSGVREYYMRRPIPIGISSGRVYPDFLLQVFEFKNASEAEDHAKWIQSRGMIWDGSCISGMTSKSPEKVVVNRQTVYVLTTRAEMLRTFTEKYGQQLEVK